MDALNKKIAIGAGWAVFTRLLVKSLGLISTVILARVLAPEDFGVIAMCMIIMAFLEVFTRFGFDVNIIQRKVVNNDVLNSAWTLKLILGVALSVILISISGGVGFYYQDERLTELTLFLSLLPFINSLQNIGFVLYRKDIDLAKEFPLEFYSKLISFIVTISFAFILESYWALVIGMYTNSLAKVFISFIMHPYRPRLNLSEAMGLFKFSKWLLLNNLLIFFNHKITDIIIGKEGDAEQLGYYTVGYEISNLPTTELLFPLSRSIFPGYAKIKDNKEKLRVLFIKITKIIVFVSAPVCFGIAITANEIVTILLGDKWLNIIPIISILAFYGFTRCAVQNIGSLFLVLNKPHISTFISLGRLIVIIPCLIYSVSHFGAIGASATILIVSAFTMPISFFIVQRFIHISGKDFMSIFSFPLLSASFMFAFIHLLSTKIFEISHGVPIIMLLIKVLIGLFIYFICVSSYLKFFPNSDMVIFINTYLKKIRIKLKIK